MLTQPSVLQSALWLALKIGLGVGVLGAWSWFVFHRFIPWSTVRHRTPEHVAQFPRKTLVALALFTFAVGWFCSWELAYREPQRIQTGPREVDTHEPRPIREVKNETLDEKSARMRAEADAEREKAKQRFQEVPPRP